MKKILFLLFFLNLFESFSQKDSVFSAQSPIVLNFTPIFSPNHFGTQIGFMKLMNQKEIHRKKHSKIILKERWLSTDLSFYHQIYLHNSLSLSAAYAFRRVNRYGFYRQIRPFIGISQTFLNEESYTVNDKNEAVLNGITGNFYLTTGLGLDFGKVFKPNKILRDIHAGLLIQAYYPNFRFIALRPSFALGTALNLPKFSRNFNKKIIEK